MEEDNNTVDVIGVLTCLSSALAFVTNSFVVVSFT